MPSAWPTLCELRKSRLCWKPPGKMLLSAPRRNRAYLDTRSTRNLRVADA